MLSEQSWKGIHDAVDEGNNKSVKHLLRGIPTDKKVDILKAKRWNVGTIMHLAVKGNQTEIIKCLTEGVSPGQIFNILKIQNNDQKTAVHIAAEKGNTDIISYLLEGIPVHQRLEIVNSKSQFHGTPLHCASKVGHVYTVKYLLECIASDKRLTIIKKRNNSVHCSQDTAIHLAAKGGHTEVLRCLLDPLSDGQRLNIIKMQNKDKETTIHLAAKGGHVNTIKYLLEAISDDQRLDILSIQNGDGNTAVHYEMSAKFHKNCSEYLGIVRCLMKLLQPKQHLTLLKVSNNSGKKIIETYSGRMENTVGQYLKKCKADAEKKIIKVRQDAKSDEFQREQEKERKGITGLCKSTKRKKAFTKINIGLMSYQNGKFCKQKGKVEVVEVSASDNAAAVRAKAIKKHRETNKYFVEVSYKLRYPDGKLVGNKLPSTGKAFCVRSYAQRMKKKCEDLTLYLSAKDFSDSDPPAKASNIKSKVSASSSSISTSSVSNERKGHKRSLDSKSLVTSKKSNSCRLTGWIVYNSPGEGKITIQIKKEPTVFTFINSQTVEWLIAKIRDESGEDLPCRILDRDGARYSKHVSLADVRPPFTVIVGNVETLIRDRAYQV